MAYQGEYDGLCGMYAIANALKECGVQDGEEIFKSACSALAHTRWPKVLWEGTSIGDMQKMILACRREHGINNIKSKYPFRQKTKEPKSNREYWKKSDEIFNRDAAICGIVCVEFPDSPILHWIVVKKDGNRVMFLDSDANSPCIRKNKTSLYAGLRRRSPTQWRLLRGLLIVFEKT